MSFLVLGTVLGGPVLASHPLITEDTGVLGRGGWQLELHGERAGGVTEHASEAVLGLSHGLTERVDLQVELPYHDAPSASGRGDLELALKWRFHDRDGLSLLLKPVLILPTGNQEQGLGAGRARPGADLVAARQLGDFELIGHAGVLRNRNRLGERTELWHLSLALLWEATDGLKLLVDFSRDTDPAAAGAIREWVYGLAYALREHLDVGIGVKNALSDAADDRAWLAGLKLRW